MTGFRGGIIVARHGGTFSLNTGGLGGPKNSCATSSGEGKISDWDPLFSFVLLDNLADIEAERLGS